MYVAKRQHEGGYRVFDDEMPASRVLARGSSS
jgi:hypothetical protein